MAGGAWSAYDGGGRSWAADACPRRHDAGVARCQADSGIWLIEGEALGKAEAEEESMKVWIYVDTNKQVGDVDHLKVFANDEAAEIWFERHDPEGVAFEYEVIE
jgi:hypothetical protein